tara:strand:- start:1622 stop:1747 length:126 start_codon:yes stop_codon:yes gene_type:complete
MHYQPINFGLREIDNAIALFSEAKVRTSYCFKKLLALNFTL